MQTTHNVKRPNCISSQGVESKLTPTKGLNSMSNLPQVTPLTQDAQTMSSREMAELCEKRHDSVKRTIETLAKNGVICAPQSVDEQFNDAMGRPRTESVYKVGKRDSYVVVAQLSPEFTARLVDRWQELETKESKPAQVKTDKGSLKLGSIMRQCVMMAKACGLKGNQAVISADHAVQKITGESPLQLLGATHLIAPVQEQSFTPTQLGELFEPKISGRAINTLLAENGYQTKESDYWVMTKQGESFGELLDTGKKHSNGTPVKQLKWYRSIVQKITAKDESVVHLTVLGGGVQ